jgi:EAL domain-containing protein (putative c-di-GMP-specific phosphodiesterase class I)
MRSRLDAAIEQRVKTRGNVAEEHEADRRVQPVPGREEGKGRVLIVEDDLAVLRGFVRTLTAAGYSVLAAPDGRSAMDLLDREKFDVIVSDINMPEMNGLQLLRRVREHDLDVPVIMMTGNPALETAVQAIEYGALRYLLKPVSPKVMDEVLEQATRLHKMAKLKREALAQLGGVGIQVGDRAGLETSFNRALASLWMAFQPIVCWSKKQVLGHEALVRSGEPALPHPGALLSAGERLERLNDVGRAIRKSVAATLAESPGAALVFVNLHTRDLVDDLLYASDEPLSRFADRVVLEITERAALDEVQNLQTRVKSLRAMGYRIAIDDLGAGYAGLTSFAQLEPEVVKLDMTLVRDIHKEPVKRKLIRSMASLCREMGLLVIAEGVETPEERDTLVDMGCDLLQGFLFAKPDRAFPRVNW